MEMNYEKHLLRTLLFFLVLLDAGWTSAQEQQIIPSSPEAAALVKYQNFPVGSSTGVPDIQIPLADVNLAGIDLPISISYHAGGFKVNEPSGSVGVGWSLSTDLQITRTIKGRDDWDYYRTAPAFNSSSSPVSKQDYISLITNETDRQPDKFYYRIIGKSGTFYFRKENNGNIVAETIPFTGVQIEWVSANCFKLTDTDGTIYWFGTRGNPSSMADIERTQKFEGTGWPNSDITAWKCSVIELPGTGEEIDLFYEPKADYDYSYVFQDRIELLDEPNPCQGGSVWSQGNIVYPNQIGTSVWKYTYGGLDSQLYVTTPLHLLSVPKYFNHSLGPDGGLHIAWQKDTTYFYGGQWHNATVYNDKNYREQGRDVYYRSESLALKRITYRGGRIDFIWSTTQNRLNTINIHAKVGTTVTLENIINFLYDDPYCPSPTFSPGSGYYRSSYYLSSVQIGIGAGTRHYGFDYRNQYCFGNYSKGSDAWGGINSSTKFQNSTTSVPYQQVVATHYLNNRCDGLNATPLEVTFGQADIAPDTALMKSGILTRITYPTGGYTEFEFGPNKYRDSRGYAKIAGGLRVEKIVYNDGTNTIPAFEKHYKYGETENGEENGVGIIANVPSLDVIDGFYYGGYAYEQSLAYVESLGGGPPFYWGEVGRERKTTYLPNSLLDLFYASGAPVKYTHVSEYQYDKGMLSGKTVYEYDKSSYVYYNPSYWVQGTNVTVEASDYHIGMLESVTQYAFEDNAFEWVHQKNYTYDEYRKTAGVWIGQVFQNTQYWSVDYGTNHGYLLHKDLCQLSDFLYIPSELKVGAMRKTAETEKWKENGQEIVKTTQYFYDSGRLQPSRTETTQTGGKTEITYLRYPYHYSGVSFATQMSSRNMVYYPVERVTAVREGSVTRIIAGRILEYDATHPGLVKKVWELETAVPIASGSFTFSNASAFTPDTRYKAKKVFERDSYGNPVRVTTEGQHITSYKWGYDHVYPVAECQNALETQFFYEGFEETGTTGEAKAGRRFRTGDYALNFAAPSGKTYKYAYWYRSGGTWNYSGELAYTGPITLTLGDAIDEVRVFPDDANLTTYTYLPLAGINSVTDAKGQTTSYAYDEENRLKEIRDHQGNIVKTYCYDYAGQSSNCSIPGSPNYYTNTQLVRYYTKNDCEHGGTGASVRYAVPAGKYHSTVSSADANNMATAEADANGQAYANFIGKCAPVVTARTWVENEYNPDLNHRYGDYVIQFYNSSWQPVSVTGLTVNYVQLRTVWPYMNEVIGRYQQTFSGTKGTIGLNMLLRDYNTQWSYEVSEGTGYHHFPDMAY